ncbi:MAG: two-component regulator propeller domain-containing protein [Ginsengibacter sp.]
MKAIFHFIYIFLSKNFPIFLVIISSSASAQNIPVRIYTAKDGLPSSYVYGAYEDKMGYLWVGTPDGLSRFDGKHFTNYGLTDGLPDARAVTSFMDSRLRYWIGTPRGVVEFKGNRFISYPRSDSKDIRWVSQTTETKDGRIWCLTNAGVYTLDVNKWHKIKLYPGYENHQCINLIETKDGSYINYGDLLVLRKPDETYTIIGTLKDVGFYYNTLSASAGQIFISTLDGIYEIKNQQLKKLPGVLGRLKGIYTYLCDSKKRFWIGRNTVGLQLLSAKDTSHLITVYNGSKDFLTQGISEDNQGSIWIGTGNGLLRISETGFSIFSTETIRGNGILRNVLQPPTGPLLINNGTLTLHAFENGLFNKKILQRKTNTDLLNNEMIIDNYAFDDKNRFWYYLRGFTLAIQDGINLYDQSGPLAHLGDQVFDVLYDVYRKKIIVAVRTQKYPCQFNENSYSVLPVINNVEVKGNIMHLHQCINDVLLFATDQGSIYSIDKRNICKLQLNEFKKEGVISAFYNDAHGDVWIIYSGRGLRRYHWQNDSLIFKDQINKTNGLPADNVSSVCVDNRDNFWVCANSNVTVFSNAINRPDKQNYKVVSFFNAEDLQMEDSYNSRLTKDLKGNIWLSSDRHLICFYPDKLNFNPTVPTVQIENIELNLQQTNWANYADCLSGIFQLPRDTRLSHENNTLGFYFKGVSSGGTDNIKYSYLLEGLENFWSSPTANDFVSFVKLPPGKYTFKVKAQLPNTSWSKPAIFSFKIEKAFWQTWWFYTLICLVLLSGIYLLFRYRLRQKINILEMRNRFSQDLHDEIGSSISGINLLSQMAAEKLNNNQPGEASEYLFKVKNYTQDVIEKLSDMVWIFNPQNDSIDKLLQRLKSYTISIALSKNIKMHFVTGKESETINLNIRQRKAIYLISKEAVNNVFKYAECSNVYYTLTAHGSKWHLQIKDDGKGFILIENAEGNGLKNMRARAIEIGAKFNIQSQPGAGTTIQVEF